MDTELSRIKGEARALYEHDYPPPKKPTLDKPLEHKLNDYDESLTAEANLLRSLSEELHRSIAEDTILYMEKPTEMKQYYKSLKVWNKALDKAMPQYIEKVCKRDNIGFPTYEH